jgi:hypothetical protein
VSTSAICPGCKVRLIIRERVRTAFITCPRCLVAVTNPNAATATRNCPRCQRAITAGLGACVFCGERLSPGGAAAAGVPSSAAVCAVCAEQLPRHAGNCPVATSSTPEREQAWRSSRADEDQREDSTVTNIFAWTVAVMMVMGVVSSFGAFAGLVLGFILFVALATAGGDAMSTLVLVGVLGFVALLIMCAR